MDDIATFARINGKYVRRQEMLIDFMKDEITITKHKIKICLNDNFHYFYPKNTLSISSWEIPFHEIKWNITDEVFKGVLSDELIAQIDYIYSILDGKHDAIACIKAPLMEFIDSNEGFYYMQSNSLNLLSVSCIAHINFSDMSIYFAGVKIDVDAEMTKLLYKKAVDVVIGNIDSKYYLGNVAAYIAIIDKMIIDTIDTPIISIKSARKAFN